MMQQETKRLLLRPMLQKDKEAVFEYRSDAITNKYQGWIPESVEDVKIFIDKTATQFDLPNTWFQLVIIEKNSQKIIGDMGIHFIDEDQVELGCTLHISFQKKGYATEALHVIIDYLFIHLSKHRITTSVDPNNSNSIRLIERLGFRKEAHFIESLLVNNVWTDDVIYSILRREWKSET